MTLPFVAAFRGKTLQASFSEEGLLTTLVPTVVSEFIGRCHNGVLLEFQSIFERTLPLFKLYDNV
jgi:hypothetical protein